MENLDEILDHINSFGLNNLDDDEKDYLEILNKQGKEAAEKEIRRRNESKEIYKNFLNIDLSIFDNDKDINFGKFNNTQILETKLYFLWNSMLKEHKEQFINKFQLDVDSRVRWDDLNDDIKTLFLIFTKKFKY